MNLSYFICKLLKKSRLRAVKRSFIHSTAKIESGSHVVDSSFGRHSFCGYDCEVSNSDVGSFCSIANEVIIGGGMHPIAWVSTSPVFYKGRDSVKAKFSSHERMRVKRTNIDHDVWIGARAIVKQGVNIGIGAVVGMGSVVTKDVEPYAIVGGCPAKVIRKRFDDETVRRLLESRWWEYSDEQLTSYATVFVDPDEFLRKLRK